MGYYQRTKNNAIIEAWYTEYMHRQKRLKGLEFYLKTKDDKPIEESKKDYFELKEIMGGG